MGFSFRKNFFPALVTVLAALASFSCAGYFENYGKFRKSMEVMETFESHKVLPDYKYYYTGSDSQPDAIIGIRNDYVMDSSLWKEVNPTPRDLKVWIDRMTSQMPHFACYGAEILDNRGMVIGIWYSLFDTSVVKLGADKHVNVYLPHGDILEHRLIPLDLRNE